MANIEEKVENLLKSKIEKIGYDLYDVEYAKEGKNYFLRIFILKNNIFWRYLHRELKEC